MLLAGRAHRGASDVDLGDLQEAPQALTKSRHLCAWVLLRLVGVIGIDADRQPGLQELPITRGSHEVVGG
jgi:hypothetical protein